MNLDNCLRKCSRCAKEKSDKAFVGTREVCRECWLYLTDEEKESFKVAPYKTINKSRFLKRRFQQS